MDEEAGDPAHARRLKPGSFTSGLSINEFAACTSLGLEPLQFVQGYSVLAQSSPMYSGGVNHDRSTLRPRPNRPVWLYERPHQEHGGAGILEAVPLSTRQPSHHRRARDMGHNSEQLLMHGSWKRGYGAAFSRMVEQAKAAGAHGIIGVKDDRHHFAETPALEYRVIGTAVRVTGAPETKGAPWTTHLAGPPLVNFDRGGYVPVSAVVERTWMAVWPYCLTKFFLEGKIRQRDLMGDPVQEVDQVSDAKMKLVEIATAHVRAKPRVTPFTDRYRTRRRASRGRRSLDHGRHGPGDTAPPF